MSRRTTKVSTRWDSATRDYFVTMRREEVEGPEAFAAPRENGEVVRHFSHETYQVRRRGMFELANKWVLNVDRPEWVVLNEFHFMVKDIPRLLGPYGFQFYKRWGRFETSFHRYFLVSEHVYVGDFTISLYPVEEWSEEELDSSDDEFICAEYIRMMDNNEH